MREAETIHNLYLRHITYANICPICTSISGHVIHRFLCNSFDAEMRCELCVCANMVGIPVLESRVDPKSLNP